ncbi:heparan-alpha-glucosaminide N-acetyltransferase domain-containing protein [Pelomonas sp. APW6]|uniref:Heparan-alpha-glucosaminide N-acetyltransferase domain-containing protein n=1 Tax=Roseateles subflavus TaxID=3053353 RepID=A0ABT7LQD3_9BURK|nr:heparan-alpha-glucosaminide N-acetyltransferase domain-containing protein [Pelomonas sp. APW6]MDL5034644.1 heparan-alpha-glucosaminide N-acetyltransferase domain-containing protein [Pelomonas sp. APW6]
MTAPSRLASVDALRGLTVAAMLLVNNPGDWGAVYWPLEHAAWNGCTPTDLIFPFFLLIAGVSLSLSTGGRWSRGEPAAALLPPLLTRAAKVIALGLVLHLLAWWLMDKPQFRLMGVLQRIGLCLALAALLGSLCRRERGRWGALAALLLGYGTLMALNGGWVPDSNLASRLDAQVLGRWSLRWEGATGLGHDPEGLLSTLGALGSTLLGLIAGERLRQGRGRSLWLPAAGLLLAGAVSALWVPWNKQLWTPSFVLWTGGWAFAALALVYELVDRRGLPPLGRIFGVNAIAAYAGAWMCTVFLEGFGWMGPLYRTVFAPIGAAFGPEFQSLSFACVFVLVWTAIVWLMDRQRWYIKL